MRLLTKATNVFGPLDATVKARLSAYLDAPSAKLWDDVHGIIIDVRQMTTVWQAVIKLDPSYTNIGLPHNSKGRRPPAAKRWAKWPDAMLVARAIKLALDSGSVQG